MGRYLELAEANSPKRTKIHISAPTGLSVRNLDDRRAPEADDQNKQLVQQTLRRLRDP